MQKRIGLFLITVVCIAAILVTGCTRSGNNPVATVLTAAPVSVETTMAATITTTTATVSSIAPTTVPTVIIATTQIPTNSTLIVTLNSAVKKTKIGTFYPIIGTNTIFLVLDITLKNNDQNKDFQYTDSSFSIYDKTNQKKHNPITSLIGGGLDSPFTSGMIPLKSEITGQIVFAVKDNSTSYKLSVYDSKGDEISSFDNINVS